MSKSIQPPVEIQAQRLEVTELQTRIADIEAKLKTLSLEHGRIRLGGHDIHAKGLPVEFLRKVMRDYPTPESQRLADAFERDELGPLREQLVELKTRLSAEEVTLGQLRSEFRSNNADQLLAQAVERLAAAGAAVNDAKAHHKAIEQRLASARMAVLENDRLQAEHAAAVAQALADGTEPPPRPEVQIVDDVKTLQTALSLSAAKLRALGDEWYLIDTEVRNLKGTISNRKLTEFMALIKAQAGEQGLRLEQVRDRLIQDVGQSVAQLMDADEVFRLRHELSALKPEVAQLRQDNRVLQDGITKLTSRSY